MFSALGMLWINTLDYDEPEALVKLEMDSHFDYFGEESTRAYAIATVMFG